ncbi:MAG: twin-arginine translocation signal domain-containing protein [Chloroflexi bacterium]|nr:twin-arginine translocation signal domain-containing protein [Chloroflexota bacterium]
MKLSRRNFLKLAGAAGAGALLGLKPPPAAAPTQIQTPARALRLSVGLAHTIPFQALAQAAEATGLALRLGPYAGKTVAEAIDGYDLAVVPAHILTGLIQRGLVRELEPVPAPALPQRAYDPLNAFSLPANRGVIGILSRGITPPASWTEFFALARTEPVHLPPADSFRAALKSLGHSINTRDALARAQAKSLISTLRVQSTSLEQAALAVGHSLNTAGWTFTLPAEGAELWEDCFCIPTTSPRPDLAQAFIEAAVAAESLPPLPASESPLEPLSPFAPA